MAAASASGRNRAVMAAWSARERVWSMSLFLGVVNNGA
jgi:hypothetical protein